MNRYFFEVPAVGVDIISVEGQSPEDAAARFISGEVAERNEDSWTTSYDYNEASDLRLVGVHDGTEYKDVSRSSHNKDGMDFYLERV